MFSKIKNALAVKKEMVLIPYSKLKNEIAKALLRTNYIREINKRGKKNKKTIELVLSYGEDGKGLITHISRISKPSRRVYLSLKEIKPVRRGYGTMIFSTPKGILTNKEAKKEKVGGEAIVEIW